MRTLLALHHCCCKERKAPRQQIELTGSVEFGYTHSHTHAAESLGKRQPRGECPFPAHLTSKGVQTVPLHRREWVSTSFMPTACTTSHSKSHVINVFLYCKHVHCTYGSIHILLTCLRTPTARCCSRAGCIISTPSQRGINREQPQFKRGLHTYGLRGCFACVYMCIVKSAMDGHSWPHAL